MKDEKRIPRSYKVRESSYTKAVNRAAKEKVKLANIIEHVVVLYAEGTKSQLFNLPKNNS